MSGARAWLAPEVVQGSSMDCGPAALACLLAGFGIRASAGRLREACQTDVDGTSIDTLEEAARALGLEAEQLLVPLEHLLSPEARALPALVVVHHASGARHFVVVWRRVGAWLQVMDPSVGRRWIRARRFLEQVFAHRMEVPASTWLAWSAHPFHRAPLEARLARLGAGRAAAHARVEAALARGGWREPAALQASLALVERLQRAGGVGHGARALALLDGLLERAREGDPAAAVPAAFWPALPAGRGEEVRDPALVVRGAVAVRVVGRRAAGRAAGEPPLPPELAAALAEPPARPLRELWGWLRRDGALAPASVLAALGGASVAVLAQALLLRGLLSLAAGLGTPLLRLAALGALLVFLLALLGLELALAGSLVRLGRHLEGRLRVAFQEKLPRLGERALQSRPAADMTERAHAGAAIRAAPTIGGQLLRAAFGLALTCGGLVWIAPETAPVALLAAALGVALPFVARGVLGEREMRARSQRAALGRPYLDAMLGLVAVRTHAAERVLRREHEGLLAEWVRAARRFLRAAVAVESACSLVGHGLALWIVAAHVAAHPGGFPPGLLLVCYWALSLAGQGQALAVLAQQVPAQENAFLRLVEPLGAAEDGLAPQPAPAARAPAAAPSLATRTSLRAAGAQGALAVAVPAACAPSAAAEELHEAPAGAPAASEERAPAARSDAPGLALAWRGVSVVAAGHTILRDVALEVRPGEHVAIVGRSGAGKSTLLGLLLGWHRPAAGELLVDGAPLDGSRLAALRRACAWVDPSVQIWNRSLLANLAYGGGPQATPGAALRAARLEGVLAALPEGLATPLGQDGGLVSGGEGQRVRLARAFARAEVRLALLDEPFCGLDAASRRALLAEARARWRGATLLCVTHDVAQALGFERVVVVEDGRVVEAGAPGALAARAGSRFRALLDAEQTARREVWEAPVWERWRVADGVLHVERAAARERAAGADGGDAA